MELWSCGVVELLWSCGVVVELWSCCGVVELWSCGVVATAHSLTFSALGDATKLLT